MTQKQRDKIGDLLLDIAKYIITAVIRTSWFKDTYHWSWYMFLLPICASAITILTAIILYDNNIKKKNKKKRR